MSRIHGPGRAFAVLAVAMATTMAVGGVAAAGDKPGKKAKGEATQLAEARAATAVLEANAQEFVGTVEGTNAYIDIRVSGKDVDVYICDGAGLITWPQGKVKKNGSFSAESANGTTVAGTIGADGASGTVTLADGSEHAFSADVAAVPAGLYTRRSTYDASGETVLAATIVLPDGTQRGGQVRTLSVCDKIRQSAQDYYTSISTGAEDEIDSNHAGFNRQVDNFYAHGCTGSVFD